MQTINLNKKVTSIEVDECKIIINLEQKYIPKEGEYFYVETKSGNEFIAIKKRGEHITQRYCTYSIKSTILYEATQDTRYICIDSDIKEIRPATKYEKALLDNALERDRKRWNSETMQIEELPNVGDFCIFWDDDKSKAKCGVLDEINPSLRFAYLINYNTYFRNCIRFQSATHFKEFIELETMKK